MKYFKIIVFLMFFPVVIFGQKLTWKGGLDFFFDNTEYAGSSYTFDQTMAGVHFTPEIGFAWDKKHAIYAGVDMLKKLGSNLAVDNTTFLAYYQFQDKKSLFRAGSFSKDELLSDYSNFFFQDSVRYYRPSINGLFYKQGTDKKYFKLWLDWTGLQSPSVRESFFLGASGSADFNRHLFSNFQTYVFHYAGTRPSTPNQHVCDNILAQASFGYKYSDNNWNKIVVSGGILAGFERNRQYMDDAYIPVGFAGRADAEYKQWGTENLVYAGQARMKLYSEFGNGFYWGNPFLRGNFYWQNKIYWNVIKNKYVTGQLSVRSHFSEGKVYFEQLFTLSADIGK